MAEADGRDPFPEPSVVDHADSVGRALLSFVPAVGGPAAKLLDLVLAPPLQRRRTSWFNHLAARLAQLEETVEGFTAESLTESEEFVTAVWTASQIALRNHDEKKLEALRNAVTSVALQTEPDANLQSVFLNLVDNLTPLHLRLLSFFEDPRAFVEQSGKETAGAVTTRDIALRVLPEVPAEAYDSLCRDLDNRGLVQLPSEFTVGLTDERPTELGHRFLRFIS